MIEKPSQESSQAWHASLPNSIPRPTYAPILLALGFVLLLAGIVTHTLSSLMGAMLFLIGLFNWIGELRHEHRESSSTKSSP